ncbi:MULTISPECIES: aa3-type cytochrome c oxidase subunit IV [Sphingopyxis]|uniref:Cytochrome C oxidase subunit IV n=1 Tax=Sphingopyxis macrogoltabida TaxID=33050 RepID=A0A0N9UWZ8_SPHMC|nr:aa3-type cytochrome c oxidase subunit IV [Sphingopyxis macrogoltabida]ALH80648.1 cytochrome C oxidase subunit IV [Sphingopyxis macrogoltabida]ALJ13204.1 cytochrome C oxidase subunit IV [Sphingopyxis macrogoltabida]AMU89330.1 cytochrome C oxidase subunit IV [Sphingopyxis macrogoltabida]
MAQQEMKAAEETYTGFLSLLKIGSIITAIVTVFVVLLIAS